MRKEGILDPLKNVVSALRYGVGVASILLTAEAGVVVDRMD